ncbi:MAG TPA: S41 family peptidase [Oscillospiraceae bacterium]|mgnify:FL=1|nr:S41 family peptidase [Oscillospiraceae bacterium]
MGRKISLGAALTFMIIAVTLVFSVTMVFSIRNFNNKVSSIIEREGMYEKFTEIDTYVRQNYSGGIDETALMDAVAQGYLSGIDDRYADYLSAEEYAEYLKSETGAVSGVGVSVAMESSGYMQVTQVYEGSAASGAGIQPGDLIIKIDDIDITADTFDAASELLTGDAGTKVTMTVRRDDEDTEMEITRRTLTINTVFATTFGDFAYIRVGDFAESTPDQFVKAVEGAVDAGAKTLIFDVRSVNTGLVSSAATMLDRLLPAGDLLSVSYSSGETEVLYTSSARQIGLPMVVLVNEGTAGAAEFFAAGMKDFNKAKLVGAQTAGYGSMQQMFMLEDGSAIRITIGNYTLCNSGASWEGTGIVPDHAVPLDYAFEFTDVTLLDSALDTQLAKAIEVASSTIAPVPEESAAETSAGTASASQG